MRDLERLVDTSTDELLLSVLRSAKRDQPPPGDRARFLASLAVGAGATVAAGHSAAAVAKTSGLALLVKWVGIATLVGIAGGGMAWQLSDAVPRSQAPAPTPVGTKVTAAPAGELAVPAPQALPPSTPAEELEGRVPPARPIARPAPARALLVAEEVAVLDRARDALRSGDASKALGALKEHDRRFSAGVLGPEAEVLRMEALAARGETKSAASLAHTFLRKNPHSPHAARVRALIQRFEARETVPQP